MESSGAHLDFVDARAVESERELHCDRIAFSVPYPRAHGWCTVDANPNTAAVQERVPDGGGHCDRLARPFG